jgi:hypothetical protein
MAAAYGGVFTSQSKSIKDGWRVGSSCRIGFLGELTGVGMFPDMASIAGQSVGAPWINFYGPWGHIFLISSTSWWWGKITSRLFIRILINTRCLNSLTHIPF